MKDSDFLILDEPTSAIDLRSMKNLQNILLELKKDKIIIIVSHNKDILKIADEIVQIDARY